MTLGKLADYTLTRELGQGGMGKVFLAVSPEGDNRAVKTVVFPEGLDARARWETVERFQREARAARSLDHPNICQVLDIGADQDTFFIVMEFLDGQSLRQQIDASGAIEVPRAVEIMNQVCEALAYAHDQGIVHRDIKPDNIMILQGGEVKLMDFGLASIVHESGVTQTGTTMGTFSYMSPEQTRGEKLDARSDIFSLGVTFYEMLTGRQPFRGEAPGAVLNLILNKDPDPIPSLPIHVSRTLGKCLRKQPTYRFQNAREIIHSLAQAATMPTLQGTMVLPAKKPEAAPSQPAAPSSRLTAPPASSVQPTGRATQPSSVRPAPDLRCPKCREPMTANTPSCWRCGTPNPAIARRKHFQESKTAIGQAVKDFDRKQKKGWFRKRK